MDRHSFDLVLGEVLSFQARERLLCYYIDSDRYLGRALIPNC